ncbi:MAG TPA: alpha/beta hydrolase [Pseudonocardiaceae bacterium]
MNGPIQHAAPRRRRQAAACGRAAVRVLLLHGMGGGLGGWDALAARLAAHLELWDVRLPWAFTGDPEWAREPDVTRWVIAAVDGVRRAAGRPVDVVVAHSFAANVVLELLAGSDLLTRTASVLVSPFYRDMAVDLDWCSVLSGIDGCYQRAAQEIEQRHGACGADQVRAAVAQQILRLTGFHPRLRFQQVYSRTPQLDLESMTVPVVVVGGSDDPAATADGIRLLACRIPHARSEILDGCGHFPMIERSTRLAEIIEDFIDHALPVAPESRPRRAPS